VCQELQRCWVFHTQKFPVCIKNGPPPKGHPANVRPVVEKWVIDERGQRRLTGIAQNNRRTMVSQLTVKYNIGAQRPIKECITRRILTQFGYGRRQPYRVPPLLSANNKKLRCSGLRNENTRHWRIGKTFSCLMNLDSCCFTLMGGLG
jgi:hypothetical protein